jgi:hypothetical protein
VAENSAWEALRHLPALAPLAGDARFLNRATGLLLGLAAAAAALGVWRAGPSPDGRALRLGTALVLVAWVAVNKVWSPQYLLYATAAGALVAAPAAFSLLLGALSVVDYHLAFEVRGSRPWVQAFGPLYTAEELLRTLVLLAFAAWLGRALFGLGRRPRPATGAPA